MIKPIIVTSLLALSLCACQSKARVQPEVYTLKIMDLERLLTETGEIGSESEVNIDAPFSSKLNAILDEGTQLKKGTVLGDLEIVKEIEERDNAQLAVQEANYDIRTYQVEKSEKAFVLGKDLSNAKVDVHIEKLRLEKLKNERDELSLIQVAEELKTLKQEIDIYTLESRERARLYEQGYLSKEESRQAELNLAEAQKRLTYLLSKAKELRKGPLKETLKKQEVAIKEAQAALKVIQKEVSIQERISMMNIKSSEIRKKKAQSNFEYYSSLVKKGRLVAPVQGTLVYGKMWVGREQVRIKTGDAVQEGVTLAQIIDLDKPLVRIFIHEIDVGAVKPGLKARVTLDAYPDQVFAGEVLKVVPVAQKKFESDQNNLRGFHAEVRILKTSPILRPGMTANVEIIEEKYPQVLALPSQAIVKDAQGIYCWVKNGDNWEKRVVVTGVTNELYTQIRSGLKAGDQVALNPGDLEPEQVVL